MAAEFKQKYERKLSDLTFNSKPIINALTIKSNENPQYAGIIVDLIQQRIIDTPADERIRYLYLMDSILKNSGGIYINKFSFHVVALICSTFKYCNNDTKKKLNRVVLTQSDAQIFSPAIIDSIIERFKEQGCKSGFSAINKIYSEPGFKRYFSNPSIQKSKRQCLSTSKPKSVSFENYDFDYFESIFAPHPGVKDLIKKIKSENSDHHKIENCIRILSQGLLVPSNPQRARFQVPPLAGSGPVQMVPYMKQQDGHIVRQSHALQLPFELSDFQGNPLPPAGSALMDALQMISQHTSVKSNVNKNHSNPS